MKIRLKIFKKILNKKYRLIVGGIFFLIFLINHDWKKIKRSKRHDNELQNEIEEICKIPQLNFSLPLEKLKPSPKCTIQQNWGTIDAFDHKWTLNKNIQLKIDSINCSYRNVERIDDFSIKLGKFSILKENQIILHDVVEVECIGKIKKNNTVAKFNNLYVQVVDNEPLVKFEIDEKDENGCYPYNLILLSYDTVSRVSFTRRLKKTFDLIRKTDNFYVLEGYNIVGDKMTQALIPILTGNTEDELLSALKNDPDGKYADEVYPFIWKELHEKNYTSIYLDDWPHVGAFTYRMRGFKNHVTKHYPKQYQIYMRQREILSKKINDYCNGDTKKRKIMMNLLTNFKEIYYKRQLNLAIMHYIENSHDSNDQLHWLDDEIFDFLQNGFRKHLFDDTIIFLYSDHGPRFNKFRSSQRYLEERLPFFSIYLPDSFVQNNKQKVKIFQNNTAKLTSPFDIHATIRDLTCLNMEKNSDRQRSISLFDKISVFRSCDDIGIAQHFCSCSRDWKSKNINSSYIINATTFVIKSINDLTKLRKDLCERLKLKKIISAEQLYSKDNYLFRLSFITLPNNGVYEAIVHKGEQKKFEFYSKNFSIKSKNDISRIDSYNEHPWCVSKFGSIPDIMLHLRKFCFCFSKQASNSTAKSVV